MSNWKILQSFHIAYGIFLFSVTTYKLIVEKMLFFSSSFLSFYFGSVLLWIVYFFLFLLTKKEERKTLEVKRSGKYKIFLGFETEREREKFFLALDKLIRQNYFGLNTMVLGGIDEKSEKNRKKRKKDDSFGLSRGKKGI